MSEWEPIETAPRDGSDILVWNGEIRTITCWNKISHVPIYGWIDLMFSGGFEDVDLLKPEPTHWMPLPEPPEE